MAAAAFLTFARAAADVFFPRSCIICGIRSPHDSSADICPTCATAVALGEGRYCPRCTAAMAEFAKACPNCHNMRLAMTESTAFGIYTGSLRERVLEFKFSGQRYLARTLGHLAGAAALKAWSNETFDAVTAVPLHWKRRRERGFDQARAIAYHASKIAGVRYRPRMLTRNRPTESQVGLSKTARVRNIRDAFSARVPKGVQTALLVDDIMTTGATISEAARTLRRAGVKKVYAAVVARAGFEDPRGSANHA